VLALLVYRLDAIQIPVFVTHHITNHDGLSEMADALTRAATNLVHAPEDIKRLQALGLINVAMLPHGNIDLPLTDGDTPPGYGRFTIGGFGFLRPHKGFLELICAGNLLHRHIPGLRLEILASLYPDASSEKLLTRCQQYIRFLRCEEYVHLETNYMELSELFARMRRCNLIVLPYQHTKESSSAAVRMALAARRPVLCTPLPIFKDANEAITYTRGTDAFAIGDCILDLYRDPKMLHAKDEAQAAYLREHSWTNVARQLTAEIAARMPLEIAAAVG
jgi:glycosyltransferase involved in cell wall biosynthesis